MRETVALLVPFGSGLVLDVSQRKSGTDSAPPNVNSFSRFIFHLVSVLEPDGGAGLLLALVVSWRRLQVWDV